MIQSPIFFTLCSNNYLAQAKTLGDSVLATYPDSIFVIGLVDFRDDSIDYSSFERMQITGFEEIGCPEFEEMLARYNVIEFNTSVKPFYIEYLWRHYGDEHQIVYLDPDIVVYRPLDHVFMALDVNSIVLTPMFSMVTEKTSLDELVALRHGMFNLGFIALKYSEQSMKLVKWWKERLTTHCLIDKPRGIFVDQKWMDLAPLLFDEVFILKHPGYNMAWWNFAERKLLDLGDSFAVNNREQLLCFFHFSGFKPGSDSITGRSAESQFAYESRPEMRQLGKDYEQKLLANQFDFLSNISPKLKFYEPKITWRMKSKKMVKKILKNFF
ncbi:MAG: hypothetical protein ACI8ZM_005525 [Crocinitomix sp.]